VSVHSVQEVHRAVAQAKEYGLHPSYTSSTPKYALQHVLGLLTFEDTCELVTSCQKMGADLTLLGWKGTGRAGQAPPHAVDLVKLIEVTSTGWIGLDACLVAQYRERLADLAYAETWEDAREGAFSMYIDAVGMQMGASSYGRHARRPLKWPCRWEDLDSQILESYRSFQKELGIR